MGYTSLENDGVLGLNKTRRSEKTMTAQHHRITGLTLAQLARAGNRNFHLGATAQSSGGRKSPNGVQGKICRHYLQTLATEMIKI